MKFFKNIFSKKQIEKVPQFKEVFPIVRERYPKNSEGDFYVENQVCIRCGAPESEAPDLIEHSKLEYEHCYFKKQPTTPDELDRAINAMQVSCISGIRYGGKDSKILKRLYDLGLQSECDFNLINYNDTNDLGFFKPQMPSTRKADFYLGCLNDCVFIDFNLTADKRISLFRVSFDGFGCCELTEKTNYLNFQMSKEFIEELNKEILDQDKLTFLVKEIIRINKEFIWADALEKYKLLDT